MPDLPRTDFRLNRFLPFRLNRLADVLGRRIQPVYRDRFGLSRAEWRVLAHLGAGEASAVALGTLTTMDKVKVSRAIASLEARGWLIRRSDAGDRRVLRLSLTAAGRAALDELTPLMLAAEAEVLAALSPQARTRIASAIADLENALEIGC